jgi:hypothetical protein
MNELVIRKRLEKVDKELHSLIEELNPKRQRMSLEELRELFNCDHVSDEDPTELIRKMRDRRYSV